MQCAAWMYQNCHLSLLFLLDKGYGPKISKKSVILLYNLHFNNIVINYKFSESSGDNPNAT